MSDPDAKVVTLFAQVPDADLPLPGSWTQVTMSNGMVAQLWNLRKGETLDKLPRSLGYVPVRIATPGTEVVHAAIARRLRNRNAPERYTLCDHKGDRIVESIVHESLDDAVTCKQCRKQLEEDGVL